MQLADATEQAFTVFTDLPESINLLTADALTQLRGLDSAGQTALCEALMTRPETLPTLEVTSAMLRGYNRGQQSCIDNPSAYISIVTLHGVLIQVDHYLQGICDSSSCPPLATPAPRTCQYTCAYPLAPKILAEGLELAIDIEDKCSDWQHEADMAQTRQFAETLTGLLSADVFSAVGTSTSVGLEAAQQTALLLLELQLDGFFEGDGRTAVNGLNPSLSQIHTDVLTQASQQQLFESQAIDARIEVALASAQTYSLLQTPATTGGLIVQVREVVADRIQSVQASGGNVLPALAEFREGNLALNQQHWKEAYTHYLAAYQALDPDSDIRATAKEQSR